MRWGLIGMLGACNFGTSVPAQPGTDAPPPDAYVVDVGIDGSTTVDTDGDGVVDATDNCPTKPNANQHDEDADMTGDVCDLCPHVAGATADGDNDMIGDICDPHPAASGDIMVRFEPFTGTALPAGWTLAAGSLANITFGNDEIAINAATGTHILLFDTGSNSKHAIDVGVRLPNDTNGTTFFTALTDVKSDLAEYMGCGLRLDTESRELFSYNDPNFTSIDSDPTPADTPMFPGTHRISFVLGTDNERCTIPKAANLHEMTATTNTRNRSNVGIRVGDVTAQVKYVVVYKF